MLLNQWRFLKPQNETKCYIVLVTSEKIQKYKIVSVRLIMTKT